MQFNSYEFVIFFFFLFLTYNLIPSFCQKALLVFASIAFYSYWKIEYSLILFISIVIDYSVALKIELAPAERRKKLVFTSIFTNLTLLIYFKYTIFFVNVFNQFSSYGVDTFDILLPIGISFYTFQTLSYSIDVYKGKSRAEKNFLDFALFVTFFPQLVAGPIERVNKLLPQLKELKTPSLLMYKRGLFLIFWGGFLKIVIGDNLNPTVEQIFDSDKSLGWHIYVIGGLIFIFKVYVDFLGYSEIARGLACLFGVRLSANFKRPFLAHSINEFWRRWHITLSSWIRDYVYIPLRGKYKACPNILLLTFTMGLFGFWHGASWNFILFGLSQGVLLGAWPIMNQSLLRWSCCKHYLSPIIGRLVMLFGIIIAALCFYLTDLSQLNHVLVSIIRLDQGVQTFTFNNLSFIYAILGAFILLIYSLHDEYCDRQIIEKVARLPLIVVIAIGINLMTVTLLIGAIGGEAFVYFAF